MPQCVGSVPCPEAGLVCAEDSLAGGGFPLRRRRLPPSVPSRNGYSCAAFLLTRARRAAGARPPVATCRVRSMLLSLGWAPVTAAVVPLEAPVPPRFFSSFHRRAAGPVPLRPKLQSARLRDLQPLTRHPPPSAAPAHQQPYITATRRESMSKPQNADFLGCPTHL